MKNTGTFTFPNMIGWSLIILIWLGYCFNYKQNTSLYPPPPFIGQDTHPYISLYDMGVFYIFHVD